MPLNTPGMKLPFRFQERVAYNCIRVQSHNIPDVQQDPRVEIKIAGDEYILKLVGCTFAAQTKVIS